MPKIPLRRVYNRILREISKVGCLERRSDAMYRALLERFAGQLSPVFPGDRPILEALNQNGICVTTLTELNIPGTSKLLHGTNHLLPQLAAVPANDKRKKGEFLIKASREQRSEHPELFGWGLEERLLNIVENYLGLPTAYHGVYLRRDLANDVVCKTRLWHLDKEDRRMVKIIVYLNDVYEHSGPFQYIPDYLTPFIIQKLRYDYGGITNSRMEKIISDSEWISCIGDAGTVIFVDSARIFHRGRVPIDSDRFTLFFDYTSYQPRYPYYCKSDFSINELLDLSQSLSPEQIRRVFWNQELYRHYQDWQSRTAVHT